ERLTGQLPTLEPTEHMPRRPLDAPIDQLPNGQLACQRHDRQMVPAAATRMRHHGRLIAQNGRRSTSVIDRLRAEGPAPELADTLDVLSRFVGVWDVDWHGSDRSGSPIVVAGELSFGWILGGTAIQDIWRVPLDGDRSRMRAFYGTTVRFYDPAISAWRSTW